MKKALLLVSAASLLLLQACGGGGGDTANIPGGNGGGTNTNPGGDTGTAGNNTGGADQGSVNAPFQPINTSPLTTPSTQSDFMLVYPGGKVIGGLSYTSSQQTADGAMTVLGTNVLSGDYAVRDIGGDASFAIGRWIKGSVMLGGINPEVTDVLTSTDGRAYHYIAYHDLSTLPFDALHLYCTGGNFTTPTYTSGGSQAALTGSSATGAADIFFNNHSPNVALSGSVTVNANGETANLVFPNTMRAMPFTALLDSNFMTVTGSLTTGPGTGVQLVDADNGGYALLVQFAAVMPSGASYIGVGRLICQ